MHKNSILPQKSKKKKFGEYQFLKKNPCVIDRYVYVYTVDIYIHIHTPTSHFYFIYRNST